MRPKTQIVYVPTHAEGNPDHPDCEYGFVVSQSNKLVFCRFWMKGEEGTTLRTKANSEACRMEDLQVQDSCLPSEVDEAWELYVEV